MQIDEGSALQTAILWLERVIGNAGESVSAEEDAEVWTLTSPEWRVELLGDVIGLEDDVTALGDWQEAFTRALVLRIRELVPLASAYSCMKLDLPMSVDTVQILVRGQAVQPGLQYAPVGSRPGFALNAVYDGAWWTIAGLEPDWIVPQWLALSPGEEGTTSID